MSVKERAARWGGQGVQERARGGGRVAVALRDDEGALGARGGSSDRCVCPRLLYTQPPPGSFYSPPSPSSAAFRLWPPLGVVIQISKSVCFHPPFPRTSSSSLHVRRASTSPPFAGHLSHQLPSFHSNPGAGLCILYSVCDKPTRYVCSCRCVLPSPFTLARPRAFVRTRVYVR